jgi:hypothetical protein
MTIPTTPPTTATPGMSFHGIGADDARGVSMLDTVPPAAYAVQWTRDNTQRRMRAATRSGKTVYYRQL